MFLAKKCEIDLFENHADAAMKRTALPMTTQIILHPRLSHGYLSPTLSHIFVLVEIYAGYLIFVRFSRPSVRGSFST